MNFKYIRNCLTCEFGFDNTTLNENDEVVYPDKLEITCAGNTELYGKKVNHDFLCDCWSVSLEEFRRANKKISYRTFYKKELELLSNL